MSTQMIRTCVEVPLPPELAVEAAQRAIVENPANAPAVRFTPGVGASPPPPSFMAVLTGRRWRIGRTLRVLFLGGDPEVRRRLSRSPTSGAISPTSSSSSAMIRMRRSGSLCGRRVMVVHRHGRARKATRPGHDELRLAHAGHGRHRVLAV